MWLRSGLLGGGAGAGGGVSGRWCGAGPAGVRTGGAKEAGVEAGAGGGGRIRQPGPSSPRVTSGVGSW